MPFITELHCHTAEVSDCGKISAAEVVEKYIKAGYTTLNIANHLSPTTFKGPQGKYKGGNDWKEKIDFFLEGIRLVKEAAGDRLNILWCIEYRNIYDSNDYLVFGVTKEFLYSNPDLLELKGKDASKRFREAGMLFCQAHPFRNGISAVDPKYLDAIEVYNGHAGHDSRNDIALMWAKKFGMKMLSGTDTHQDIHIPSGGIETDMPITSNEHLLEVLKSGNYTPLHIGEEPIYGVYYKK